MRSPELGEDWDRQRSPDSASELDHGETIGVADLNRDGRLDIVLGQTSGLQLFLQQADGRLVEASDHVWVHEEALMRIWLVSLLDLNDDGATDIYLGRNGRNSVLLNHRSGHFSEVDVGVSMVERFNSVTTSASFGDLDRDGDYDLVLGLEASGQQPPEVGDPDRIFIQGPDGFVEESQRLVEDLRYGYTYGAPLMDLDNDGWLDIYVMNHMSDHEGDTPLYQNHVLRNDGTGHFERWEETGLDVSIASMGSDVVDLNGDGFMDLMVAGVLENMLLVSTDGPVWVREDYARGMILDGQDDRVTAWASTFADLDNDSRVDVIAGFGPSLRAHEDEPELQPDAVWLQHEDGTFEQVADDWGLAQDGFTKALAVFDYDRDGWLDVLKSEFDGPAELWLARCGAAHMVQVELDGPSGDPHGIGSRITVQIGEHVQTRWIHSQGTGLITSVPFEAHFGVGEADFIDRLQVDWLDGTSQIWLDVPSHQRLRVTHP
jgi:hypothetical protein